MRLYIGNIPYNTTEAQLIELFGAKSVTLPTGDDGRPKGFAFAEIEDDEEAKKKIESLNGTDLGGRTIAVSEARPREERSGGGGGYRGGNDRNGGGRGNWNH